MQDDPLKGKQAPTFCLPSNLDKEICLKEFQGSWVILYFYPRDNTPGCTLEAIQFNREMTVFSDSGAVVIGVSPDTPESHQRFVERHSLGFLLLSDTTHTVLEVYGVWKPKKFFGKELLGVERSTFLIDPKGEIVEIWRKVKVPGHATEVLAALNRHQGTR